MAMTTTIPVVSSGMLGGKAGGEVGGWLGGGWPGGGGEGGGGDGGGCLGGGGDGGLVVTGTTGSPAEKTRSCRDTVKFFVSVS